MVSYIKKLFDTENFVIFILVLFCIRYIPLESRAGPSVVKTIVSGFCAIYLLSRYSGFTKGVFIGMMYFMWIFISASMHIETFRWSTILYLLSFLLTFMCFYNAVWEYHILTIDRFIKAVKYLLYAYVVTLLIQQCFLIVGIKYFPPVNLCQILDRGIGANSLSGEPSTEARVMTVLMYAYIKCTEYRQGYVVAIRQMFEPENKWVTIGYLYAILTMGSGTAFLCVAILSLYFIRFKYSLFIIPLYIGVFLLMSHSDNESFHRVTNAVEATMTGDIEEVRQTDTSAAARINPMLNTINNLQLYDPETWIGHGIDWSSRDDVKRSANRMVGDIGDYGLIAYILSLILVFSCSISFFSLATIMFFLGVGGGTGNIAYAWGILMVFSAVKYFHQNRYNEFIYEDEDDE